VGRGHRRHAFAPRFPKPKLAGWWLLMGEADELFALKRIHLDRGALTSELHFAAPDEPGEYLYSVRLVSDSYIGLDGEVQVTVVVSG
jgi:activating signal cointegrator complex subunit 3